MRYTAATTDSALMSYIMLRNGGTVQPVSVRTVLDDIRYCEESPDVHVYGIRESDLSDPRKLIPFWQDVEYLQDIGMLEYDPDAEELEATELGAFFFGNFRLPDIVQQRLLERIGEP